MVPNANADGDTALNYISNVDRDTGSQALKAMIEEWERLTDKETRQ